MPAFYHILFVVAFSTNAFALWTVRLATPSGKLLPHPKMLGIHVASTAFVLGSSLAAYIFAPFCVAETSAMLLLAAHNAFQIPMTRGLGEEHVLRLLIENARKEPFWAGLLVRLIPSFCFAVLGLGAMFLSSCNPQLWGFWVGIGISCWSISNFGTHALAYLRFRKMFP